MVAAVVSYLRAAWRTLSNSSPAASFPDAMPSAMSLLTCKYLAMSPDATAGVAMWSRIRVAAAVPC